MRMTHLHHHALSSLVLCIPTSKLTVTVCRLSEMGRCFQKMQSSNFRRVLTWDGGVSAFCWQSMLSPKAAGSNWQIQLCRP